MLAQNHPLQFPAPETHGQEDGQLAAPFEDIPQHHYPQPGGAEEQPEPSENLKRREVGVLDSIVIAEPRGGCSKLEPGVLKASRQ